MATISSGRWDWWNEYTEKDEVVDCLIMLSDALGRWPTYQEVTEVWPKYTLRFIQEKFGSYETAKSEASSKLYRRRHDYRVKKSPKKLAFTPEQKWIIAEIAKRPKEEPKPRQVSQLPQRDLEPRGEKPITTPKSTEVKPETRIVLADVVPTKGRPGRKPTFSDEQLLTFARQIVAANDGVIPTMVRAKELLREQNGPSLATMTNRLGPISGWERRLENAS